MIPSRVRIKRNAVYNVVYQAEIEGNKHLEGLCVRITVPGERPVRQIILKKGMSRTQTELAFIHELIHAIEFEYEIAIPHALIYLLEAPIHKILKLNDWI
ncbi:MAG: hypothetical protein EB060_10755 [Proteobacteria bacterium]|nr:hypothetical protein [Pseudomonadota bacterium]